CIMSPWTEWSACSASCGLGSLFRQREVVRAPLPGGVCDGPQFDTRACFTQVCSVDGDWSEWSGWSQCDVECGGGVSQRNRSCSAPPPKNGGRECEGMSRQSQSCNTRPCTAHTVDGGWSDWSRWSPCSSQCGSGEQTRDRLCNSPAPQHGGLSCSGPHIQSRDCNSQPCSGTHTLCVCVCVCVCAGFLLCDSAPGCRVDGAWGQWGPWTGCSLSCGGGEKLRKRLCDNPPPEGGARGCVGVAEQQKACNTQQCTGDSGGPWWSWSQWSVCSVSCGGGQQARSRLCRSEPLNNPKYVVKKEIEISR
uniref:Spondin-like TSP1 domain-containing protein n=1 Tax=Gouania willdenowi TaxID=441366 RepID=A0A8C5EV38_GOUWI